jgi:cytochrome c peroxidase
MKTKMRKSILLGLFIGFVAIVIIVNIPTISESNGNGLSPKEELGKFLFFDENLSIRLNQSCATCHAPEAGFTGPDSDINDGEAIYPGSIHTKKGNRKPPTAAYGGDSPVLYIDESEGNCFYVGGMFWDGRATGETLGDPLAEQALGPFLNFLEQANPKAMLVCLKVQLSDYADLFEQVWGPGSLDCVNDLEGTYNRIGLSIADYEKSSEVNPFSSKYDLGALSSEEQDGLALFEGKGKCALCHVTEGGPGAALFTDFTYDNLGIPKNPLNPFYDAQRKFNPDGEDWIDPGLGGFLANANPVCASENYGKHKVPTLRNVDKRPYPSFVKAYGHNGFFKSLEEIVHFYNTRDVDPDWDPAEEPANVNTEELGDLGLSFLDGTTCWKYEEGVKINLYSSPPCEEDLIVMFMKTLSDGWTATAP